jgi:hypothetical protein
MRTQSATCKASASDPLANHAKRQTPLGRSVVYDQFAHVQAVDLKLVDGKPIDSAMRKHESLDGESPNSQSADG